MKTNLTILCLAIMAFLTACGGNPPTPVEPRATFELFQVYINGEPTDDTVYAGSTLMFIGPETGGNVLIRIGESTAQASIHPSREHPSFADGYWHHHLYAGSTTAGSPRINFLTLFPHLGIDTNPEATDNTQSSYQHGNLHYIVETGMFRLRFIIDTNVHDLFFTEV